MAFCYAQPAQPAYPAELARLRDARHAGPPPATSPEPLRIERRVSSRGAVAVAGQRIHVGMIHAGLAVAVTGAGHTFRVQHGDELIAEVARTTTKPDRRFPQPPTRYGAVA
jgi:hypothetical protein